MPGKDTEKFWPKEDGVELKKEATPAKKPTTRKKKTVIGILTFECHGWCEELGRSYTMGKYIPKTEKDYKALLPYSVEGKK